jgi:hypothetical protein
MTADAEVEMADYVPNDWRLSQGSIVCQMRDRDPRDARLIAAAPELLAALDGIMQWWMETESGDDMPMDLFVQAHDALAKAKP